MGLNPTYNQAANISINIQHSARLLSLDVQYQSHLCTHNMEPTIKNTGKDMHIYTPYIPCR